MRSRRIAILLHEDDSERTLQSYLLGHLVEFWRADGHEVVVLFGTRQFVPADLIFVHVDLSVVPRSYLAFAARYPVAINGRVRDIRKSIYSEGVLRPGDRWNGPVIVKTNRNYGGAPERRRGGVRARLRRKADSAARRVGLDGITRPLTSPHDYCVYDQVRDVPSYYFYHPGLIIQKFMPEVDNGMYCVRLMSFLGDSISTVRLMGSHPVVNGGTTEIVDADVAPDPAMLAMREHLGFDYGKFDYVVVDGRAILLDANKTVGSSATLAANEEMVSRWRARAEALYRYFRD